MVDFEVILEIDLDDLNLNVEAMNFKVVGKTFMVEA